MGQNNAKLYANALIYTYPGDTDICLNCSFDFASEAKYLSSKFHFYTRYKNKGGLGLQQVLHDDDVRCAQLPKGTC